MKTTFESSVFQDILVIQSCKIETWNSALTKIFSRINLALIIIVGRVWASNVGTNIFIYHFCEFLVAFGYRSILISTGRSEIKAIQLVMVLFTNCECSFNRYLAPEYFVYGKVTDKTDVYAFVRENNWNEVNQYKKACLCRYVLVLTVDSQLHVYLLSLWAHF